MTFIASVIAKKGVAIIADSLVTSQSQILHYKDLISYLGQRPKDDNGTNTLPLDEIVKLFNSEAIYTKDFEEKLFKITKFSAMTTTGIAYINGKSISGLIEKFKTIHKDYLGDEEGEHNDEWCQGCTDRFIAFLLPIISEHVEKHQQIGECIFIFAFYRKLNHTTAIYKLTLKETASESMNDENFRFIINSNKEPDWLKVVCDGQNKLSERILFGISKEMYSIFPAFVENVIKKLDLSENIVPENFVDTLLNEKYFSEIFFGGTELLNLTDLSLQQAVDLASLLMRIEVDFQRYTRNVPTVGGVIKLAVIDDDGFRFIAGDKIESPKHIHI